MGASSQGEEARRSAAPANRAAMQSKQYRAVRAAFNLTRAARVHPVPRPTLRVPHISAPTTSGTSCV